MPGGGDLRIGVRSKSERGYALLKGDNDRVVRAEPVRLHRSMKVGQSFQAIARSCLRQSRLNEPGLTEDRNSEALHQARVAIRRFRSALSIFEPLVADGELPALKRELRALSAQLGEARNLDVYLADVIGPEREEAPNDAGLRDFAERVVAAREAAYDAVAATHGAPGFKLFTIKLAAWFEAGSWLSDPDLAEVRQPAGMDFRPRGARAA